MLVVATEDDQISAAWFAGARHKDAVEVGPP